MVCETSEEEERKFTECELLDLLEYNKRPIKSLSKKFFYFTYLDNEDLEEEGVVKIIEIVKKWERGEISVTKEELNRYIGTSLVHLFVDLVRLYPSDKLFDPVVLERFYTSINAHLDDNFKKKPQLDEYLDYMFILNLLQENLNSQEFKVASYFLYDYTRRQIAEAMNLSIKRIDAIKSQIKNKMREFFK